MAELKSIIETLKEILNRNGITQDEIEILHIYLDACYDFLEFGISPSVEFLNGAHLAVKIYSKKENENGKY